MPSFWRAICAKRKTNYGAGRRRPRPTGPCKACCAGGIDRIDHLIQKRLREAVHAAGLRDQVQRCQAIDGIGELTATALVMAFLRGDFQNSDAFVAFLGLDVRVRDSGKLKGKRRLTKQGDTEVRRLLHCSAMSGARHPTWKAFYQRYRDRGLKTTQALVILARKLARVAFALMKHQENYCAPRLS